MSCPRKGLAQLFFHPNDMMSPSHCLEPSFRMAHSPPTTLLLNANRFVGFFEDLNQVPHTADGHFHRTSSGDYSSMSMPDAAPVHHCIRHASSSLERSQPAPTFEGSLQSPEDTGHRPEQHPLSRGSWHVMLISYRNHELTHWLLSYFTAFHQVKDDTLRECQGNYSRRKKHTKAYKKMYTSQLTTILLLHTYMCFKFPSHVCMHTYTCLHTHVETWSQSLV